MNYIEVKKEDINFKGDTKAEKKANEVIYDLTLEIDRLQHRIAELSKVNEEHRKLNGELRKENVELKEKNKVIDEAINFIINHSKPEQPSYEYLKFYNLTSSSKLLEILERGKNVNTTN